MLFRTPNQALISACKKGNLDKVIKLMERAEYKSISKNDIQEAFNEACYNHHEKVALYLISKVPNKNNAIIKAIDQALLNVVKKLVADGVDTNVTVELGIRGITPLQAAIYDLNEKIIIFLLENGADVNKPDRKGSTPFHWLLEASNVEEIHNCENPEETQKDWDRSSREIAEILLKYGAKLNPIDNDGQTPLDVAEGEINCLYDFMRGKGCKTSRETRKPGTVGPLKKSTD